MSYLPMRQAEVDAAQNQLCKDIRTAKKTIGDYEIIECFIAILSENERARMKVSITYPNPKKAKKS